MIAILCLYLFTTFLIALVLSQIIASNVYFDYMRDMPAIWATLTIIVFSILFILISPIFIPIFVIYRLIKDFNPFIDSVKKLLKKLNND